LWWRNCTSVVKEAKTGKVKGDEVKGGEVKND
jgi:hypothetical protein